jgi:hypothetical protein
VNGCTLAACRGLNEDGTCPCGLVTLCEAVRVEAEAEADDQ